MLAYNFKILDVSLLIIFLQFLSHTSLSEKVCFPEDSKSIQQKTANIHNLLHKLLQTGQCTMQLFFFENSTDEWLGKINIVSSAFHLNHGQTNGATISKVSSSTYLNFKKYTQPEKMVHSKRCSFVFIFININSFSFENEVAMEDHVILPLIKPSTIRNRDKYMFITDSSLIGRVYDSKLFKSIKYKIILEINNPNPVSRRSSQLVSSFEVLLRQACQYGLCSEKLCNHLKPIGADSPLEILFPDLERNFYGHTLRLSTTTKVPQLLEMEMEILKSKEGKPTYYPKRGLYAYVLDELSRRLNFTSEIVPSSGSGSTGHALPNGTWVGIVGDTFRGEVDFGFMASVTYPRFPYAEPCAPINFAYMGFVTGPPRKSYAWNAILWPFQVVIWIGLIMSMLVASVVVTFILKVYTTFDPKIYSPKKFSTLSTYFGSTGMLTRVLLDQSNLPVNFSNSFRMFLTFWLLISLVISAAYQCKMVSLLTFPVYDPIPTSFDELAAAENFPVDFHYFGNVGYTYFKTSTNPSFVTIFNKMGREPDALKCMKRSLTEKAACITFIITFQEILYRNLSDSFGKSPLKFNPHDGAMFPAGVIHQYKAPLSDNFKSILYPAMESGLIPFWQHYDLNKVLKNKNDWQKANKIDGNAAIWGSQMYVNDNLLRVRNLTGAFIIFGVGLTAAIFAFVFESLRKYWKNGMSSCLMIKCGGQLR